VKALGFILALTLSLSNFGCDGSASGKEDLVKTGARAADTIAVSIKEMISVKRALAQQGTITPAQELALTQTLLRVNTADKALVQRLKALTGVPDAATKTSLLSMVDEITSAIDDLNRTGLLPIQSESARNQLSAIMKTLTAAVQIIRLVIESS
jgi:hypothetical protein